jgi:threonine/homoserine/homoserine lactone efflux protein
MAMIFFIVVALLPGFIAEQRRHRHPMAVTILGFGIWFHPIWWLLALLWAWKGATVPPPPAR